MFNASFASAVIIMTFIIVRGFQALALLLRYPHPKFLPSGKGLTVALLGSMLPCRVLFAVYRECCHVRNYLNKRTFS